MKIIRCVALAIALSILSLSANAAAVYTYNSITYTVIVDNSPPAGTYTAAMSITAEFTFASALAPSMAFGSVSGLVQSFTISDGRNTITDTTASDFFLEVATNALGEISSWEFSSILGSLTTGGLTLGEQRSIIQSANSGGFMLDRGVLQECVQVDMGNCTLIFSDLGQVSNSPGSWTMMTTSLPEPGTLSLLAIGLAGIAWVRRRKIA